MRIVIIGGRGNGTVIAATIEDCRKAGQKIECIGFMNDNEKEMNAYPVLGGINQDSWKNLSEDVKFIYALSTVKKAPLRYEMLLDLDIPSDRFATVIHPTAVISDTAVLGNGVVLMPLTVIGPNGKIGNHSQMYAQSFIGHNTTVGEMVFIANNANLGANVLVNTGAHIGSNSSVLENVEIGKFAVIGLGSVVLKSVTDYEKAVGNPARIIGKINQY